MKIELDNTVAYPYRVNSYKQGSILIGTQRFTSSFIVTPSMIIDHWSPQTFTDIALHHFDQILDMKPELILLGTGHKQHFPDINLFLNSNKLNIGFEVMDTGAACRSYNILLQEGRNIAAALLMIK